MNRKARIVLRRSSNPLRKQRWWWSLVEVESGLVILKSSEGYANKAEAVRMARRVSRSGENPGPRPAWYTFRSRSPLRSRRFHGVAVAAENGNDLAITEGLANRGHATKILLDVLHGRYTVTEVFEP